MNPSKKINWYPGHMAKGERELVQNLKLVDAVMEIVDARCPQSTHYPAFETLKGRKPFLVVLAKADLADEALTAAWIRVLARKRIPALANDALSGRQGRTIIRTAASLCSAKQEKERRKGMIPSPVRLMIIGMPNVGKSTLINQLSGRSKAVKTGGQPGVTRTAQWIRLSDGMLLMDTPGILQPKIENEQTARRLACLNCLSDDLYDPCDLSLFLLEELKGRYGGFLEQRYALTPQDLCARPEQILEMIARNRGFLKSGGQPDPVRASRTVLEEFRQGRIGRITLEAPDEDGS